MQMKPNDDLTTLFTGYLRAQKSSHPDPAFLEALESSGYALESHLLREYSNHGQGFRVVGLPGNYWHGRRAWLGPQLPDERAAGDLWFDTVQIMPMLLVARAEDPGRGGLYPEIAARMTPFNGWIALRPAANWQFRAYMQMAGIDGASRPDGWMFTPFDRTRIALGQETAPAGGMTCTEARGYALWFGMGLSDQDIWQDAMATVPPAEIDTLWGSSQIEWGDAIQEDAYVALTRDILDWDLITVHSESTEYDGIYFFGDGEFHESAACRTAVSTQLGVHGGPGRGRSSRVST